MGISEILQGVSVLDESSSVNKVVLETMVRFTFAMREPSGPRGPAHPVLIRFNSPLRFGMFKRCCFCDDFARQSSELLSLWWL